MDFLLCNNLLSDCQYGFRPKSSTQDTLLTITRDWHQFQSTSRQMGAVFFDIKKAFDSVPHNNLLQSLADIGISGQLRLLITSLADINVLSWMVSPPIINQLPQEYFKVLSCAYSST